MKEISLKRFLIDGIINQVFGLENIFLNTLRYIYTNPSFIIDKYYSGAFKRFVNPIKFYFIVSTIFVLYLQFFKNDKLSNNYLYIIFPLFLLFLLKLFYIKFNNFYLLIVAFYGMSFTLLNWTFLKFFNSNFEIEIISPIMIYSIFHLRVFNFNIKNFLKSILIISISTLIFYVFNHLILKN